jgi:hypothetical protein
MLGSKRFGNAAIVITGVELAHTLHKGSSRFTGSSGEREYT